MHDNRLTGAKWTAPTTASLPCTMVVGSAPARTRLGLAFRTHDTVRVAITSRELDAIFAGIFAGEVALDHRRRSGVLKLFVRHAPSPSAAPKLEALRAYAELRRVFPAGDWRLPAASLSSAGFSEAQIVKFDAIIVAWPKA